MKQFLVILGLTALVWLGVSLAEDREYPLRARVEMSGYDTLRYAVVHADTAVSLRVTGDGYSALLYSLFHETPVIKVDLSDRRHAVAADDICEIARQQLIGIQRVESDVDSLRITLAPRSSRTYRPLLDDVTFNFAEQYGLYGQPTLEPEVVTLYGPAEDLDHITQLRLADTVISEINSSSTYRLKLQPVWKDYHDVHPSCTEVNVRIPVESFVERQYTVPITITGVDTTALIRLYPEQVTLTVWVAQRDINRTPEFTVTIPYSDVLNHGNQLTPQLTQFPDYLRPRSISPSQVQCVIIR